MASDLSGKFSCPRCCVRLVSCRISSCLWDGVPHKSKLAFMLAQSLRVQAVSTEKSWQQLSKQLPSSYRAGRPMKWRHRIITSRHGLGLISMLTLNPVKMIVQIKGQWHLNVLRLSSPLIFPQESFSSLRYMPKHCHVLCAMTSLGRYREPGNEEHKAGWLDQIKWG